jgi:hypothetical protein
MAVVGVHGSATTLSGVSSVTAGSYSYCAVLASTGVDCWGEYFLGNNTIRSSDLPVPVLGIGGSMPPLSGVASMGSMGDFLGWCVVLTNATADCWGYWPGNGTSSAYTPVVVLGVGQTTPLSGVASIAGDSPYSNCALLISGRVDCWGAYNQYGEFGDGRTTYASTPRAVLGVGGASTLGSVLSLEATNDTVCAVLKSGGVDCWGSNRYGQLGDGTTAGPQRCAGIACSTTPVVVKGTSGGTSRLSLS